MSTGSATTGTGSEYAGETAHPDHEAHQHTHPSDRNYIVVALILAVITLVEVSTYFIEDASTGLLVAMLFPMMIAKFAIVCGWFMHLKYDNPIFRRSRRRLCWIELRAQGSRRRVTKTN